MLETLTETRTQKNHQLQTERAGGPSTPLRPPTHPRKGRATLCWVPHVKLREHVIEMFRFELIVVPSPSRAV